MINYHDWPIKAISVKSLRLDVFNPRLSENEGKISQANIINHLIENQNAYALAKTIAIEGYFPNEMPIVCKENNKYIVLEGNRRVTACKVILEPELITSSRKKKILRDTIKDFDLSQINKLQVLIAPSRQAADVLIMNRHGGGAVVDKWDKTKSDRFIYNRFKNGESIETLSNRFTSFSKSDIKKAIIRYNVYKEIVNIPLPENVSSIVEDESKFSITNIERLYESKDASKFLGIDFEQDGKITKKLPKVEFIKRWTKVISDAAEGNIDSRKLNTENDKKNYINNLIESGNFDTSIEQNISYNDEYESQKNDEGDENDKEDDKPQEAKKKKKTNSIKLFDSSIELVTGEKRIDDIFTEIKTLNISKNPNAISVLFRSYLDMLCYTFLDKSSKLIDLKAQQGLKVNEQNKKVLSLTKDYIIELGVSEDEIDDKKLSKNLKLSGGIGSDWTPSLMFMLDYIASSDTLIDNERMRQALKSYIGKDTKIIGHKEFNLLVHNQYYTVETNELRAVWDKLYPMIEYLVKTVNSDQDVK